MTHRIGFCLAILLLSFAAGCTSVQEVVIEGTDVDLVWPPPPDTPKIRFLKSVSKIRENLPFREEGGFGRAWKFLAGERKEYIFSAPYGVTADDGKNLFVVDRDTGVIVHINLKTGKADAFYHESADPADFPIGIAVAKNIYVTYPRSGLVRIFDRKGRFKGDMGGGILTRPTGIAVNRREGLLYVVDTLAHDVKVFDLGGRHLFSFGGRGEKRGNFNYPTHAFVSSAGDLYVTDELNFRIQVFSKRGKYLFELGKIGSVPGTFQSPKGVAVDSDGNIYVADAMADSIQIFDRRGKLLLFFGGSGTAYGRFWSPSGLFIDDSDRIYIADLYNARVQVFRYLGSGRGN